MPLREVRRRHRRLAGGCRRGAAISVAAALAWLLWLSTRSTGALVSLALPAALSALALLLLGAGAAAAARAAAVEREIEALEAEAVRHLDDAS